MSVILKKDIKQLAVHIQAHPYISRPLTFFIEVNFLLNHI